MAICSKIKIKKKDLKNTKKYSDACNEEKSRPHIKKTSKGEVYVDDVAFTVAPHSVFDGMYLIALYLISKVYFL